VKAALILLTTSATAIAIAMALLGMASWLEAASFVTGAVCVWLTVKENVWNFPIGLANVATFSVVFFQTRLFADAALQVVYFVLGVIGWWLWLYGGEQHSTLRISRASAFELLSLLVVGALGTVVLWQVLNSVGGSASFWDALTTSISLVSQWLLNRKQLESWFGWILVDAIYIPLYISKDLYLTAALYAVFLVMATMGLRAWRASMTSELLPMRPGPVTEVAAP
jgi:nicotinamide mononucleotide transporter